jgi:hypothetical protein
MVDAEYKAFLADLDRLRASSQLEVRELYGAAGRVIVETNA